MDYTNSGLIISFMAISLLKQTSTADDVDESDMRANTGHGSLSFTTLIKSPL